LHQYVPDSWNKSLEYTYIEALKVEAKRFDELNIDRSILNLKNTMLDLNRYLVALNIVRLTTLMRLKKWSMKIPVQSCSKWCKERAALRQ
jgi:hypothetical protein